MRKKQKIDLDELNWQTFTVADALGLALPEDDRIGEGARRAGEKSPGGDLRKEVSLKGAIRLSLEKKGRGGKIVTKVSGLAGAGEELALLMKDIKKRLGCGAEMGDSAVFFQGDQRERLLAFFQARGAKNVKIV